MSVPPDYLYNQLSRFPNSLLRWFGIPGGQNPSMIRRDYQPVLDLWEWLTSSNSAAFQSAGTAIGAGAAGSFVIHAIPPSGGMSYVLDYTLRMTPIGVAGGDFSMVPCLQTQAGSGVEVAIGDPVRTIATGAASAGEVMVARNARPFFLGPNAVAYSAIVTKNTLGNAATLFGYFRYVELSA